MKIVDSLLSDKKTVIIMAVAYVTVVVIALIIIWKPDGVLEISKYEPYNEQVKLQEMASYYFGVVKNISAYNLESFLEPILSKNYLHYAQKNVNDVMKELRATNGRPTITNVTVHSAGDKVIYVGDLTADSKKISLCIVEKFPYNIELTLDNFIDYYNVDESVNKNGITVKAKDARQYVDYIEYDMEVINNSAGYLKMDFSIATNIYVELENSQGFFLKNPYDTVELNNLRTNEIAKRTVMFGIPITEQDKIKSLNFSNVIIDGKKTDLEIVF